MTDPRPSFSSGALVARALASWDGILPVDLVRLAADHGARIAPIAGDLAVAHGRTVWQPDGTVVITVGAGLSANRMRFVLAHEIAHVLLAGDPGWRALDAHGGARPDEERVCDRMAARLLVPDRVLDDLLQRGPKVGLPALRQLAQTAQVSQAVAAARITERRTRPCSLLRWRRSPTGAWLCVSAVAMDEARLGIHEISLEPGSADVVRRLPFRHDKWVDLDLRCRGRVHRVHADVRRDDDMLTMLLDGGLLRSGAGGASRAAGPADGSAARSPGG